MESRYKVIRDIEVKVYIEKHWILTYFGILMVYDISMFEMPTFDCTCMVGIHYIALVWFEGQKGTFHSTKNCKGTWKCGNISEYSIQWQMYKNNVYLNINPITIIQQDKRHSMEWNFVNFKVHLWTDYMFKNKNDLLIFLTTHLVWNTSKNTINTH